MATTPPRAETTVFIYQIDVSFDTTRLEVTLGRNMPADGQLHLPQGISMLVFNMLPTNGGSGLQARIPVYPIQWLDAASNPTEAPPYAQAQWFNHRRFTLVMFNSSLVDEDNQHRFNFAVVYDGKTYGNDPIIINDPPGG
jgi:hypothetical protein